MPTEAVADPVQMALQVLVGGFRVLLEPPGVVDGVCHIVPTTATAYATIAMHTIRSMPVPQRRFAWVSRPVPGGIPDVLRCGDRDGRIVPASSVPPAFVGVVALGAGFVHGQNAWQGCPWCQLVQTSQGVVQAAA